MATLAVGCHPAPGISGVGSCVETADCAENVDDCASWLIGTRRLCSSCRARVANRLAAGDCVRAFPAGAVVIANGLIIAVTVFTFELHQYKKLKLSYGIVWFNVPLDTK